jgi:protein SDA1
MANFEVSLERLSSNLPQLQNLCKRDPETYREEFLLQLEHFDSQFEIFKLQQGKASADFIALATFLSQCSGCYPAELKSFPLKLIDLLDDRADILERQLRLKLVQNLVLVRNRGQLDAMPFFSTCFRLFRLQDKPLRLTLFNALVSDVQNTNVKRHNLQFNRELRAHMRKLILGEEPLVAKKTLEVLVELYKTRTWNDPQTVNIVADGCFAKEMRIKLACVRFFLGIETDIAKEEEKEEQDHEDYNFSKAALKTHQHSKKTRSRVRHNEKAEKKKKLMTRRKQEGGLGGAKKPLLKAVEQIRDPQTFAEKLFRVLRSLKKIKFEEKLMFMDLVSRLIGVHKVLLLNFYSYLQNYLHVHQVRAKGIRVAAAAAAAAAAAGRRAGGRACVRA